MRFWPEGVRDFLGVVGVGCSEVVSEGVSFESVHPAEMSIRNRQIIVAISLRVSYRINVSGGIRNLH